MANLTSRRQIFSADTTVIDTVQQYPFLSRAFDTDGNEYIYLTGVGSTIVGSWVTYDELGITTLLVANAVGPVAVAMAIINSTSKFGWYQIFGTAEACVITTTAADAKCGFETTAGYVGDGMASGDVLTGAITRESSASTTGVYTVQLSYPFATDASA